MLRGAGTEVPRGPGRTSAVTGRIVCRGDRTRVRPRLGGVYVVRHSTVRWSDAPERREPAPHGRSLADWLYRRSRNIAPAGAGTAPLLPPVRDSGSAHHDHGDDRRLADSDQRRIGKAFLALHADRVATRKDEPGEIADPIDHCAFSWRHPIDHV